MWDRYIHSVSLRPSRAPLKISTANRQTRASVCSALTSLCSHQTHQASLTSRVTSFMHTTSANECALARQEYSTWPTASSILSTAMKRASSETREKNGNGTLQDAWGCDLPSLIEWSRCKPQAPDPICGELTVLVQFGAMSKFSARRAYLDNPLLK